MIGDGKQPKCGRCEKAKRACVYQTGRRFRRSSVERALSDSQPWVSLPSRSMDKHAVALYPSNQLMQYNFLTSPTKSDLTTTMLQPTTFQRARQLRSKTPYTTALVQMTRTPRVFPYLLSRLPKVCRSYLCSTRSPQVARHRLSLLHLFPRLGY